MAEVMPISVVPPFPPLEEIGFVAPSRDIKDEKWFVTETNRLAEDYRIHQAKHNRLDKTSKISSESTSIILGHFLLLLALALRITKVSGELINEGKKKTNIG